MSVEAPCLALFAIELDELFIVSCGFSADTLDPSLNY